MNKIRILIEEKVYDGIKPIFDQLNILFSCGVEPILVKNNIYDAVAEIFCKKFFQDDWNEVREKTLFLFEISHIISRKIGGDKGYINKFLEDIISEISRYCCDFNIPKHIYSKMQSAEYVKSAINRALCQDVFDGAIYLVGGPKHYRPYVNINYDKFEEKSINTIIRKVSELMGEIIGFRLRTLMIQA